MSESILVVKSNLLEQELQQTMPFEIHPLGLDIARRVRLASHTGGGAISENRGSVLKKKSVTNKTHLIKAPCTFIYIFTNNVFLATQPQIERDPHVNQTFHLYTLAVETAMTIMTVEASKGRTDPFTTEI